MKILKKNKIAYFNYNFDDILEAGLVLTGARVKSIREGEVNFTENTYIEILDNEVFIINLSINKPKSHTDHNWNMNEKIKLLLNKKEIFKLKKHKMGKNVTIIPLNLHIKNNKIKVDIALAIGKKNYDKRQTIKERDLYRESQREN